KICPSTINASWKSDKGKIIKATFGASITAPTKEQRQDLITVRQENDQCFFPRDQNGIIIPRIEFWEFGNCVETNSWIRLSRWRPDLPIESRTISVRTAEVKTPCQNCKICLIN